MPARRRARIRARARRPPPSGPGAPRPPPRSRPRRSAASPRSPSHFAKRIAAERDAGRVERRSAGERLHAPQRPVDLVAVARVIGARQAVGLAAAAAEVEDAAAPAALRARAPSACARRASSRNPRGRGRGGPRACPPGRRRNPRRRNRRRACPSARGAFGDAGRRRDERAVDRLQVRDCASHRVRRTSRRRQSRCATSSRARAVGTPRSHEVEERLERFRRASASPRASPGEGEPRGGVERALAAHRAAPRRAWRCVDASRRGPRRVSRRGRCPAASPPRARPTRSRHSTRASPLHLDASCRALATAMRHRSPRDATARRQDTRAAASAASACALEVAHFPVRRSCVRPRSARSHARALRRPRRRRSGPRARRDGQEAPLDAIDGDRAAGRVERAPARLPFHSVPLASLHSSWPRLRGLRARADERRGHGGDEEDEVGGDADGGDQRRRGACVRSSRA